jgi:high-affinity iron transporter
VLLAGSVTVSSGGWTAVHAQQEKPAKRLANIVGVAVEEYGKGVDSAGRLISQLEYEEAVSFLHDARGAAARLSGDRADSARIALDSMSALVSRRVGPQMLSPWLDRFMTALGADAALDLPSRPVDLADGQRLYRMHCSSCHGPTGLGDGAQAKGMVPPPPAVGRAADMRDRTPAILFRIVSVGVAGTPMVAWSGTLSVDQRWSIIAWLNSLRSSAAPAVGQGLYVQRCAACHGASGGSDGTLSRALSRLPVELSSFGWQAERTDAQLASAIRHGVAGTAMPPARDLTDAEADHLVGYVRTLSLTDAPASATGDGALDPERTVRAVMTQLDEALSAARGGRTEDASDRAFDAYIAFEPLETPARARAPGRVASLERHFAEFKGAIRGNDLRTAERSRNAIEQGMPGLVELARPAAGQWGAFYASFLIILREGFEAILVIGAIVALLLKTGHRERLRSIWTGVLLALGASALTAFVLATVLRALPATREVIEGVTMLVAVAVLFSVSYWLISKVEAARWQQFIREKVDAALAHGGGTALVVVAFLAVYREGAETALFYQALFNEATGHGGALAAGIVAGGAVLAVVFTLFHRYGVKIPLRPFFAVTSVLLYYMAFVFMGKGVSELQEGNLVPVTPLPGWPQIEPMGIFPSVETLLAQVVLVLLFVFALLRTFWPKRAVALPTLPASAGSMQRVSDLLEGVNRLERRIDELERRIDDTERAAVAGDRDVTGRGTSVAR